MSQYPVVVMPDAVLVAVTLLNDGLPGLGADATAYDAVPTPRPAEFVTVRRTGGPRYGKVHDRPQLTVSAWSTSDEAAMDLAQMCAALFASAPGTVVAGVPVGRVEGLSLYNDPDPLSGQPRATHTLIATMRGTEETP